MLSPTSFIFRRYAPFVVIAAVTAIVYANTLNNSLHLDDYYRVKNNPGIHQISQPWRHFVDPGTMSTLPRITQYRPLLPLTLSVNYAIAGDNLPGYHLGNILFQLLASLLVYLLILELLAHWVRPPPTPTQRAALSLASSLAFAIHPVSAIPVNYICARDQLLMQMFLLGSAILYVRMRRLGATFWRWALVVVAVALSLLSKTDFVVAPAFILFFEITLGGERLTSWRAWLRTMPFAGVVIGFFAFERLVLGFSDAANVLSSKGESFWAYPFTQARLHLFRYIPNFFWPFPIRQEPLVELSPSLLESGVILGGLFILGTIGWALWRREREPLLAFCVLGYWILLFPTSGFLRFHHIAVDYRPYPSSPFFFLALAVIAMRLLPARALPVLFTACIAWLGGTAMYLNTTWRTDETLWRYSIERGGGALAHHNYAMAVSDLSLRRKHMEEALRLAPNYILAHVNLGRTLVVLGLRDEGLEHLKKAVAIDPRIGQTRYWYAKTLADLGRFEEAAAESREAARLEPNNHQYQAQAARDAQRIGDHVRAAEHLKRAREIEPTMRDIDFDEALALQRSGRVAESVPLYVGILRREPENAQAHFNIAHAYMTLDRCAEALPHFERVLVLRPSYHEAHLHFGHCLEKLGDAAAAKPHLDAWEASQKR